MDCLTDKLCKQCSQSQLSLFHKMILSRHPSCLELYVGIAHISLWSVPQRLRDNRTEPSLRARRSLTSPFIDLGAKEDVATFFNKKRRSSVGIR